MTHVALLRGINVGGRNKLAMRALAALFTDEGGGNVRTFIQSGNVLYDAPAARARALAERVAARLSTEHGLRVPIVVRTAGELAAVPARNPFRRAPEERLHVLFLRDAPDPARLRALDPARSPPDELAVVGRDVYLHLPNGVARSKLTNDYFDRALATVATARNWRTVLQLIALAGS